MFLALFWVDAPKQPFVTEPWEGANQEIAKELMELRLTLMIAHFFCFLGLFFVSFPSSKDTMVSAGRIFAIFSMLVQVLSISLVCQQMFTRVDNSYDYSEEFSKYHHWFQIEVCVTLAGLSGIILYMLFRSCMRQRGMHLKLGGSFGLAQTDFLDAQLNVTGIIVTMTVPFFTVNFIRNRLQVSFPNDPGMRAVEFQHLQTLA
jgi:hypothetical protein